MNTEIMNTEIQAVSLAIQIKGKPYYVALPQDKLKILVTLAESLSENNKLRVVAAPANFKFASLRDFIK